MQNFNQLFTAKADLVTGYLVSLFPETSNVPEPLCGAMSYTALCGGKRLRPVIMLAVGELFGAPTEDILATAAAIELIHTYSLVHDDLPCMDDDDMRRNRPTCHMIYGEGMAILSGDGLLNYAYEVLLSSIMSAKDMKRSLKAANVLARAAGASGMIAGQCYDLKFESSDAVTESDLLLVHSLKTSKLVEAAADCGAILGGASDVEEQAIVSYAKHIGLAFQITDDVLDIEGDSKLLGKPTGSDLDKDKLTFPKIYGLEKSKELAALHTNDAISALSIFDERADFLRELAKFLLVRTK